MNQRQVALFGAALVAHRVAPPPGLASPDRPRDPAGRCYELAGRYFVTHGDTDGVRLVHGLVVCQSIAAKMGHAWVELPGDIVYDRGWFFDGPGYRAALLPEPVRAWTNKLDFVKTTRRRLWGACDELVAEIVRRGALS